MYREEKPLSPRGMTLLSEIFDKCDTALFRISFSESTSHHTIKICKHSSPNREYMVTIPKDGGTHGSRFGTCTCGFPRKEGVPCDHMVAVLKVGAIPSLTRVAIMPYWFAKEQWRAQFPENERCALDITLATIKAKSQPVDNIRYCPAWTAGQKKGRPKKEQRHLGIADHIQNASKKRKQGGRSVGSAERDAKLQSILEDEEAANVLDNLKPVEGQDGKEGEIVGEIGCAQFEMVYV